MRYDPHARNMAIREGHRVNHPRHGAGTVTEATNRATGCVRVRFDNAVADNLGRHETGAFIADLSGWNSDMTGWE